MSATAHLDHLVPTHHLRADHLAQLRVRIRRLDLDRRLAAGEDPRTDLDLARRAGQLTEGSDRGCIAMVLDRLVGEAAGQPVPFSSKVPLARAAITACAPGMLGIAGRLWEDGSVAPQGVAKASLLLREGSSPLYSISTTEVALRFSLSQIAIGLEVD